MRQHISLKKTDKASAASGGNERRKKNKRAARRMLETVFISPDESMVKPALYVGLVLRTLLVYIGILGISAFICGAAGLTQAADWRSNAVTAGTIALISLIPAAACGIAAAVGKFGAAVPLVYVGAYFGICAASFGDPISFTYQSAVRVYNFALYHVASKGYYSLGNYMVQDGYDYANAAYDANDPQRFFGVFLLCSVVGLILFATVQKRVRLVPLALFCTAVIAPILTYNLPYGNAGTAFLIVFICGAIAMWIYDRRYDPRREKRLEKKAEGRRRRQDKRAARRAAAALHSQTAKKADSVYRAALLAGVGRSKAKAALRAVYAEGKRVEKLKKSAADKEKNAKRLAKKAERKAAKAQSDNIKALRKSGRKAEADAAKAALKRACNERSAQSKAEKKALKKEMRAKKRYAAKKQRKVCFAGGYAGAGTALCAFLAVWIPLSAVSANFRRIPAIDSRVTAARAYVTAYLRGDDIDLNELYAYGIDDLAPRELTFDPLEYKDTRNIFRIDAGTTDPVYLRSWIGSDFDLDEGRWTGADYDTVLEFRSRFGKEFTPDEIGTAFYKYVYPSSAELEDFEPREFYKYGFSEQRVNVWRVSGSSRLLFIPSRMNTDYMLLGYGKEIDAPYKYSIYFDGIYSSRFYKYGSGYSTVSYVQSMSRKNAAANADMSQQYYMRCRDFILENADKADTDDADALSAMTSAFDASLAADGIEYMGTSLCDRFFNYMSADERAEVLASFETESEYRDYVYESYTNKSGSAAIEKAAADIAAGFSAGCGTFEKAIAVANYFNESYKYTKEPDKSLYDGSKPVIEAFLEDVKEGYCTHFATATCEILREYGIPTRFAEGYAASEFESTESTGTSGRAYVNAENAHSWVEAYIDGMGWVTVEVTPGEHSDAMYRASDATMDAPPAEDENGDGTGSTTPSTTPAVPIPGASSATVDTDGVQENFHEELMWFLRIIAVVAAVALVGFLIYLILRRIYKKAADATSRKFSLIDSVGNAETYEKSDFDRHGAVRKINDWTSEILALIGAAPETGELTEEYAERISRDFGGFSDVDAKEAILLLQKEEFGHGLSSDEAAICARYTADLISGAYRYLPPLKRLWARYIRHIL